MKSVVEDIKKGSFKPVYLFYGEEAYLKQQYKNRLKDASSSGRGYHQSEHLQWKRHRCRGNDRTGGYHAFFAEHRLLLRGQPGSLRTLTSSWQNTSRPYQRKPSCCLWKVK